MTATKKTSNNGKRRCEWSLSSRLMTEYHDREWGVPCHEDRKWFEFMILDAMQAGLSWEIVLRKREGFQGAFARFDPAKVARYGARDVRRLLADPAIVRNELKIRAAIDNARAFLKIQGEFGSFDRYIWNFVEGRPVQNRRRRMADIPATSSLADRVSKDLKQRGFRFVGPTIVYAFLQAAGIVNDHVVDCFRYREIARLK